MIERKPETIERKPGAIGQELREEEAMMQDTSVGSCPVFALATESVEREVLVKRRSHQGSR